MMHGMDTVAARLKYARELRGLSVPGLARAVQAMGTDIKYQSIQAIEDGGGSKHLNALAKALNVRLDWLERGEGPIEEPTKATEHLETPKMIEADTMREAIEGAEKLLQESGPALPPDAKADVFFAMYHLIMRERAKNPSQKFDPSEYANIIELFARR